MDKKYVIILGIVGAVVVMIIALVASSLKRLNSYEVGIQYDQIWKKLKEDPFNEGLHLGPVGYTFIIFPSVFKSIEFTNLKCLNKDGVHITLDVSYQYRARPTELNTVINQFKDHDGYVTILENAGETAIHEACSLFNTTQFQSERGKFQESVGQKLINKYDGLYCDVSEIQVSNINRPGEYESAIKQKEAARENIKVAENERPRQVTQATTKKREAETEAEITVARAESEARIRLNKAETERQAILDQFSREAETYEVLFQSVQNDGLALTNEGFLSYMGIRAISNAQNDVHLGMDAPAKTSYTT